MDNEEQTRSEQESKTENSSNKLTIEIRRFQNLLEILKDYRKLLALSLVIILVGIVLFCGITLIVLSIKRLYPYNDITTNAMGTTTLKSENKNVSYFLLSSSELWANSGIHVKKGETLTIKSSGKKHSAIHHLVNIAKNNKPNSHDPWVGSEGFSEDFDKREDRDRERARYRIFPKTNQDILLLQIVPDDNRKPVDRPDGLVYNSREKRFVRECCQNTFLVVGNKMDNIHVDIDGTLYFAINDIVLDDETIIKMILECDGKKSVNSPLFNDSIVDLVNDADSWRNELEKNNEYKSIIKKYDSVNSVKNSIISKRNKVTYLIKDTSYIKDLSEKTGQSIDTIKTVLNDSLDRLENSLRRIDSTMNSIQENHTNKYYKVFLDKIGVKNPVALICNGSYGEFQFGNGYGINSNKIELFDYFMNKYKNAWYEDNVGSFLILVEKVNE